MTCELARKRPVPTASGMLEVGARHTRSANGNHLWWQVVSGLVCSGRTWICLASSFLSVPPCADAPSAPGFESSLMSIPPPKPICTAERGRASHTTGTRGKGHNGLPPVCPWLQPRAATSVAVVWSVWDVRGSCVQVERASGIVRDPDWRVHVNPDSQEMHKIEL